MLTATAALIAESKASMSKISLRLQLVPHRPAWIKFEDGKAYIRLSYRTLGTVKMERWVDLANVNRPRRIHNMQFNPKARSTGFMRRLMTMLEDEALRHNAAGVYVENVLNEFLPAWFERRGYTKIGDDQMPCFYKRIDKEKEEDVNE